MITIGIPRGHFTAPWEFFFSLYNATNHLVNKKIPSQLVTVEGPIIDENRNDILMKTLPDTYLIMIDDDMSFPREAIYNLYHTVVQNSLDLCCGLFFTEENQPVIQKSGLFWEDYPKEELFEVDACGMAFTMFSSKLVKEFRKTKPFQRIGELGEDLSFCKRVRDAGYKLYCDSRIRIGHLRLKSI